MKRIIIWLVKQHRFTRRITKISIERNLKKSQLKDTEVRVTTKIEIGEPQENIWTLMEKNDI